MLEFPNPLDTPQPETPSGSQTGIQTQIQPWTNKHNSHMDQYFVQPNTKPEWQPWLQNVAQHEDQAQSKTLTEIMQNEVLTENQTEAHHVTQTYFQTDPRAKISCRK